MYARVTSFKVDPARLDELKGKIAEMRHLTKTLPGVVDIYAAWRGDGQGVITAIYRSKADADAAVTRIQILGGAIISLLQSAPRTDTFDSVEHIAG